MIEQTGESQGDGIEESSSSGDDEAQESLASNSSEDEADVANMVMPKVMKVVDESSDGIDSNEEGAKGFLANTMGLIKEKDAAKGKIKASKIADDLNALFGKHV